MSAALVRKSLSLVDSTSKRKAQNSKNVVDFLPNDKKLSKKIHKRNSIGQSLHGNKLNIEKARQKIKSKEETLKRNLRKLELIRKICTVDLDEKITNQLIQRATTKRPVQLKSTKNQQKEEKTVFTDEDFQRFEKEYMP